MSSRPCPPQAAPVTPDAAHLHQRSLRFPGAQEDDYLRYRAEQSVFLSRLTLLLGALFYAGFLLGDRLTQGLYSTPLHYGLILGMCMPCALVYLAATYEVRLRPRLQGMALATVGAFAVSVGMLLLESERRGLAAPVVALVLVLAFNFFFMGMLFHVAVRMGILVLVGFALGKALTSGFTPAALVDLYFVLIAVVLGSIACRMQETTHRRAWLHAQQLRELSEVDPLTGAYNYRAFFARAEAALRQARRENRPVALLVIDVDHFKQVNDRYGHLAGDDCLRQVGQLLCSVARRPLDLAARLGGEEFALLLYNAQPDFAQQLAEAVRSRIAGLSVDSLDHQGLRVTASVGVVCAGPNELPGVEGLVARADAAMYRAKSGGRNRVAG